MNTLTDKQKELLSNPDVKAIAEMYLHWWNDIDANLAFDSFASQFERKVLFVTEDGVDVCNDDLCYPVHISPISLGEPATALYIKNKYTFKLWKIF